MLFYATDLLLEGAGYGRITPLSSHGQLSSSPDLCHSALVYFVSAALLIGATQLKMVSSQHPHMVNELHCDIPLDAALSV